MPTIKDVAKKANVSVATVSRVINNTGYVNHETRKIVEDAIGELGYVPNELARSLFRKRSNIIGLIVPHISTYFFGQLIESLEEPIMKKGYKLMIFNSKDDIEIEKKYYWQIQMNLLVTGRQWWDLVVYNPNFKKTMYIKRYTPNLGDFEKLYIGLADGEKLLKTLTKKFEQIIK